MTFTRVPTSTDQQTDHAANSTLDFRLQTLDFHAPPHHERVRFQARVAVPPGAKLDWWEVLRDARNEALPLPRSRNASGCDSSRAAYTKEPARSRSGRDEADGFIGGRELLAYPPKTGR